MTPEEVFAQLRDIHAPDASVRAQAIFDIRPLAISLALVAAAILIRAALRRIKAERALSRIDTLPGMAGRRDALIRLAARRHPRQSAPAPEAAFQAPHALTAEGVRRLRRWVGRRIR